ncbi:DUF3194 domain-containing protein [Natronolimnohabitans sp. A-GB9]|uniref:DUF3194 domain-containing protein n=1 Tax=Natronolimnohabitans sp. A-GB9 TaxID=3069757 RepID=UPI0027B72D6C|nr:DUF3194 domain-containing protein [Natronolimnohabitans sp. A-GB9]MDQ2049147.1 DUF3194 domain-containing protein [Natronolimnohabitans sp. A-GB9]
MPADEPTDDEVVQTASDAAEGLIFSRYKQSSVRDCDVTVTFEDGVLEVDVYLNVPEAEDDPGPDPEQVADAAARTAREAVDELFEEST